MKGIETGLKTVDVLDSRTELQTEHAGGRGVREGAEIEMLRI